MNIDMENITYNSTDIMLESFYLQKLNEKMLQIQLPAIIYTGILMIVGLPGNFIVIYVYFFKWRRSTSRMFILFLALLDLINCMTTLPMEIFLMRYSVMLDIPFVCKLSRFSTFTMNSASALILLGIAVDRFKRICKPYQKTFSESISKYISVGAIVLSVTLTCPAMILYGTRNIRLGNIIGKCCLIENKYDFTPFPIIFFSVMGFMTFVIFTTLSVLYYCVGMQIYKHRKFKKKNCSHVVKVAEDGSTEKSSNNTKQPTDNAAKLNENGDSVVNGKKEVHEVPLEQKNVGEENDSSNKIQETNNQLLLVSPEPVVNIEDGLTETGDTKGANCVLEENGSHVKRTKKRRQRVRYVLVRGSSTINSSGRTKCVNCLTVRVGKSTFMLFLITIAYIISFLPFYTIVILRQSIEGFVQQMSAAGSMAYHVFLRSYLLSSAINPVIYSFCNPQFRGHCIDLFKRIFTGKSEYSRRTLK